ncbi:hypothetical protein GCM10010464_01520 [Pseudonocardia yunnanensis]
MGPGARAGLGRMPGPTIFAERRSRARRVFMISVLGAAVAPEPTIMAAGARGETPLMTSGSESDDDALHVDGPRVAVRRGQLLVQALMISTLVPLAAPDPAGSPEPTITAQVAGEQGRCGSMTTSTAHDQRSGPGNRTGHGCTYPTDDQRAGGPAKRGGAELARYPANLS